MDSVKIQSKRKHDNREAYADTNIPILLHCTSRLKLVVVLVEGGDLGLQTFSNSDGSCQSSEFLLSRSR